MKSIVTMTTAIGLLLASSIAWATQTCEPSNSVLAQARDNMMNTSATVYDHMIPKPDESFWENCVGNILNGGTSFGLTVPNLTSLVNQACRAANSTASGALQDLDQQLSIDYGGIIGGSTSGTLTNGGSGSTTIQDSSSQIFKSIWDAIQ